MKIEQAQPVFEALIAGIEQQGVESEGLYRVSGVKSHIESLVKALGDPRTSNSAKAALIAGTDNIHTLTAALKLLLRELTPPVIPSDQYAGIMAARRSGGAALALAVAGLPPAHVLLLRTLRRHLAMVALEEKRNRMTLGNLALMFGPNWMRSPMGEMGDLADIPAQTAVAQAILEAPPGSALYGALGFPAQPARPASPSSPPPARSPNARLMMYASNGSAASSAPGGSPPKGTRLSSPGPPVAPHAMVPTVPFGLSEAFAILDGDKDGKIGLLEFSECVRGMGYVIDSSKVKDIFTGVDKDRDGEVTREQISAVAMPLLAPYKLTGPEKQQLADPFAFFDKGTKAGKLSKDEFIYLLRNFGGNDALTHEEVLRLVADLAIDGDHGLDYNELQKALLPMLA